MMLLIILMVRIFYQWFCKICVYLLHAKHTGTISFWGHVLHMISEAGVQEIKTSRAWSFDVHLPVSFQWRSECESLSFLISIHSIIHYLFYVV